MPILVMLLRLNSSTGSFPHAWRLGKMRSGTAALTSSMPTELVNLISVRLAGPLCSAGSPAHTAICWYPLDPSRLGSWSGLDYINKPCVQGKESSWHRSMLISAGDAWPLR